MINDLQKGDLLFQLRVGGDVEYIISRLFAGRNGVSLNHVAIACGNNEIIEACRPQVHRIKVDHFLQKSVRDTAGQPCVIHARILPELQSLTDAAVSFAEQQVGQCYDDQYSNKKHSNKQHRSKRQEWYCSELILEAFRYANKGHFVFPETPMSFRDMETGELFPYWTTFFKKAGKPIPEGEPGSHPALMSCSEKLEILSVMGQMPARQSPILDVGQQLV